MSFTTTVNTTVVTSTVVAVIKVAPTVSVNNVNTSLSTGVVGASISIVSTSYLMRAWDTVNTIFVFWKTTIPSNAPTSTTPTMSGVGNLVQKAIVHQIV